MTTSNPTRKSPEHIAATITTEKALALLLRLAPIAADVRAALAATRDLIKELPAPSNAATEISNLRGELEEAEGWLEGAMIYLTAQPENSDCTLAALERRVELRP